MTTRTKRIVVFALTGLILLGNAGFTVRQILVTQTHAWTGLAYLVGTERRNRPQRRAAVMMVIPGGPADRAGLRVFDGIISVNGISVHDRQRLDELISQVRAGDTITYRLRREGKEVSIPVVTSIPLRASSVAIGLLIKTAVALVFFAIGLLTYYKKPDDRRAFIFYIISVVAASHFLLTAYSVGLFRDEGIAPANVVAFGSLVNVFVITISTIALAPLLLHLALVFPRPRPIFRSVPQVLKWVYASPFLILGAFAAFFGLTVLLRSRFFQSHELHFLGLGILAVIEVVGFVRLRRFARLQGWTRAVLGHPWTALGMLFIAPVILMGTWGEFTRIVAVSRTMRRIVSFVLVGGLILTFILPLLALYPILTIVSLIRSYRETGIEEKQQLKWPLWGTSVSIFASMILAVGGFIVGITWGVIAAWRQEAPSFEVCRILTNVGNVLGPALYLLIPVSFAFAILKYRLMDIDLIIKRTITYSLVTGIVLLVYLVMVGGAGRLLINTAGVQSEWIIIMATLTVGVAFMPVRNRVQAVVDRRFFRKRYDYPQTLTLIARELSRGQDATGFLQFVSEQIIQTLQNRSVVIFNRAPYDQSYVATAKVGVPDEILGKLRFEAGGRLPRVLAEVSDVPPNLAEDERAKLRSLATALLVPVRLRGELLAFVALGKKLSNELFDDEDRQFLVAVADHLALGLNRFQIQRHEQELENAREIQQALLPRTMPYVAGCEIAATWLPARVVGGDYYDVLTFSDGKTALCIADVVGKGMPAALLMSNLQAAVKAFASDHVSPSDLCAKLNRTLCTSITAGRFITFFYAVFDSTRKRLVYTNAGHNRPVLVRSDGSAIQLDEGGPVLGVFPDTTYQQGEVDLQSGGTLVLFTDGLTEAINDVEEEFGDDRLIELLRANIGLSASELQARVLDAVTTFTRGNFHDDVAIVVVVVRPQLTEPSLPPTLDS